MGGGSHSRSITCSYYLLTQLKADIIMYGRDESGKSKATNTKITSFNEPSIKPILITPNHLTFSAQLLYPHWSSVRQDAAYVRNTIIHFFRADEQSSWNVISLPENDRFTYDANARSLNDFEQRYFKFLSGGNQISFNEGKTPHETAENAFCALRSCYPSKNQNVLNDPSTKSLLKTFFSSVFTNTLSPVLMTKNKTPSEIRTEDYITQNKLEVSDYTPSEYERVKVYKENSNYTKVVFDTTTVHLYLVGTEVLMFADTEGYNSLAEGVCILNHESPNWAVQIKDAWLKQQVNICLGTKFNPETKNHTPYKIKSHIPVTIIGAAAEKLLSNFQAKNDFKDEGIVQLKNHKLKQNELKSHLQEAIRNKSTTTPTRVIMNIAGDFKESTWPLLQQVIIDNDTEGLLKLINENNANVNGCIRSGDTVLINSIHRGKIDIVKLLIEHNANLEHKDNYPSSTGQRTPLQHAVSSKNKDIVVLLLQAGAEFEIDSLTKFAQQCSATEIIKLLHIMEDYKLNATQANALLDMNAEAWTWITQGLSTNIELPFDILIYIASDLLNLDLIDTCQVMLAVLNKFTSFQNDLHPEQPTQLSAPSLSLFATKLPCEQLTLIKNFIKDELAKNSITVKGQFMECKAGYIKDRPYGCHLGIGANTGLAYIRDKFLSIELKGDKVCCSKAVMNNTNNCVWKELTKDEIINEMMDTNSLISQIINHQQVKQESSNTPKIQ